MRTPRLALPARLTVSLVAASCSSSHVVPGDASPPTDVATDVATDVVGDATASDAADVVEDCNPAPFEPGVFECLLDPRADAGGTPCEDRFVCTAGGCPAGCRSCPTSGAGVAGYVCLAGADASISRCPTYRVCDASECPAGCTACAEPLFCIPDSTADAAPSACSPDVACDPSGCPPGCRAVA